MEMNSLGTILLFAIKNGAGELHITKNSLPTMISPDGKSSRLCGVIPISTAIFDEINLKYLSNDETHTLRCIGSDSFLVFKIADTVIFRHLPTVEPLRSNDKSYSVAYLNKKGLIVICSESQDLRIKNSYSVLASISERRTINALIIEREKYYSLPEDNETHIISMYRPDIELEALFGMSRQINFECLLVPNCNSESAIKMAEEISEDKLVIIGIRPSDLHLLKKDSILYTISINDDGTYSKKTDQKVKIDESIIIKNLRGAKHA